MRSHRPSKGRGAQGGQGSRQLAHAPPGPSPRSDEVSALQRAFGNRAVHRSLARGGAVQRAGAYGLRSGGDREHIDDLSAIRYAEAAQVFERRLGAHAANHPRALHAADEMVRKLSLLVEATGFDLGVFGTDKKKRTGSVGASEEVLRDVVARGNFREKMTFVYNGFVNHGIAKLFARVAEMEEVWGEALFQRPRELTRDRSEREKASGPKKTPLRPEEVAAPPLSAREQRFAVVNDRLQWEPGMQVQDYKLASMYQQEAHALMVPVGGGRSGTTYAFLQIGELLGVDLEGVRLACLGWMILAGDHTFYEIMTAAKLFDASLEHHEGPFGYRSIAPLGEDELRALGPGGRFPDEYLDDPYKDDLAVESQAKALELRRAPRGDGGL